MEMHTPTQPHLEVGERWSYVTRPGEESSTFVVVLIEGTDLDRIVHIRVDDILLDGPVPQRYLASIPMLETALLECRLERLATGVVLQSVERDEFEHGLRVFNSDPDNRANHSSLSELLENVEDILTGRDSDVERWEWQSDPET